MIVWAEILLKVEKWEIRWNLVKFKILYIGCKIRFEGKKDIFLFILSKNWCFE